MNFDYTGKNLIYKVMAGSRAYGTDTPSSDTDWKGIIIPPIEFLIGNQNFEQHMGKVEGAEPKDKVEYTYFALKKFAQLAAKCNPNVIEMLYVRDQDILQTSKWAERLRGEKEIFLSKAAVYSFTGYAYAQLNRIKLHRSWLLFPIKTKPLRSDFELPEQTLLPKDQLGAAQAIIRRHLHELSPVLESASNDQRQDFWEKLDELLVLYAKTKDANFSIEPMGHWSESEDSVKIEIGRTIGFSEDFLKILSSEKAYSQAKRNWDSYQNWLKTRNPERAKLEAKYSLDTKHAMHLIRLLRMGKELVETGTLNVYRSDREELNAIRNGAWTYEQIVEWAEKTEKQVKQLANSDKCPLPYGPNHARIGELLVELQLDFNGLSGL